MDPHLLSDLVSSHFFNFFQSLVDCPLQAFDSFLANPFFQNILHLDYPFSIAEIKSTVLAMNSYTNLLALMAFKLTSSSMGGITFTGLFISLLT